MKNYLEERIKDDNFWVDDYLVAIEKNKLVNQHGIENSFWRESIKRGNFELLSQQYPKAVEHWVRFSRIFKNPLWQDIRPVCKRHLGSFVHDCEKVALMRQQSEDRINKHKALLELIPAETLVVHFAYWLEKKYFEEPSEGKFINNIINYRNVLQECLMRLSNVSNRNQGDIEESITKYLRQIETKEDLEGETSDLFEVVCQWLKADLGEEMFCYQDWSVRFTNNLVSVVPRIDTELNVLELSKRKLSVSNTFEFELPFCLEDHEYQQELINAKLNPESFNCWWHVHTGKRFLERTFGGDNLKKVINSIGFKPFNALQVLLVAQGSYEGTFFEPRFKAKQAGSCFLSSIIPFKLIPPAKIIELIFKKKQAALWRQPVEPREFFSFVDLTKRFFKDSIPNEETQAIFESFTADMHVKNEMDFERGKHFLLLKNHYCYLLLPRLFFSHIYILENMFNKIFDVKKLTQQISDYFEKRIEALFSKNGFRTIQGHKFKYPEIAEGDIDVLAFRDNVLFVVQAKMSHQRFLVHNIRTLRDTFQKAGDQMDVALDVLSEHWPDISSKLNISTPYSSVKKVTLIVSNSFEYDHQYFNDHLKVSYCELENVLEFLDPFHLFELRMREQATPSQIPTPNKGMIEQYRLYPTDNPSVDQIIACLEESRFWKLVLDEQIEPTPLFSVPPVDSPKKI